MSTNSNLVIHPDTVLDEGCTLEEALASITANRQGVVVTVDGEGRLTGVVSLGDIRRSLTPDVTEGTPLNRIANRNPIFCQRDAYNTDPACATLFAKNPDVMIIPVLDEERRVIGTVLRP